MKILLLNGPNLDRLGTRQPEVYGSTTLATIVARVEERAASRGATVESIQSADAEALADAILRTDADAIVINPASLTHHSRTLATAIASCGKPIYEVHISNIHAREPYRRRSMISAHVRGVVAGLGTTGYLAAIDAAIEEATG